MCLADTAAPTASRSSLFVPSRSGVKSRSRTSSVSRSYIDKIRSGRSCTGMTKGLSRSGFEKSGRMIDVDRAEYEHMESMIKDLQAQVDALKGCPINDVLKYIMENSNTMDCTIADDVCPMSDMPMAPSGSGMASKSGYSKSGGSYMPSASGYSKSGYS